MAAGLGLLRLSPRSFWSMTLKELEAALGILTRRQGSGEVPTQEELALLLSSFPD